MPPRTRKSKAGTPVTTATVTPKANTKTTPKADPPDDMIVEKVRKERVTAEQAVILSDFVVAENAPAVTRKSTKLNPFSVQVRKSYEKNLEAVDQWIAFTSTEAAADNQLRLIRAAASSMDIGSAIRVGEPDDLGNVTIWFRGQERKVRKSPVRPNDA